MRALLTSTLKRRSKPAIQTLEHSPIAGGGELSEFESLLEQICDIEKLLQRIADGFPDHGTRQALQGIVRAIHSTNASAHESFYSIHG